MFLRLFVIVSLIVTSLSATLQHAHVIHERRTHSPHARGWKLVRRLEPNAFLPLRIGLSHSNIDRLHDELIAVSDPRSPLFGQHWTPERVANFFAPASETVDAVKNWLVDNGIDYDRLRLTKSKSWLEANVSVAEAEELLKTEYHVWADKEGLERVGMLYSQNSRVLDLISAS